MILVLPEKFRLKMNVMAMGNSKVTIFVIILRLINFNQLFFRDVKFILNRKHK
jgi:hypothetical protein